MGAYDCDCTENLAYEDRNKRATMQCRDCNFYARYVVLKKMYAPSAERKNSLMMYVTSIRGMAMEMHNDDFCGFAERRTGES